MCSDGDRMAGYYDFGNACPNAKKHVAIHPGYLCCSPTKTMARVPIKKHNCKVTRKRAHEFAPLRTYRALLEPIQQHTLHFCVWTQMP